MRGERIVVRVATLMCEAVFLARDRLFRHRSPVVRLQAELTAAREEVLRLRAECDILRGRPAKMPAPRRPHYPAWLRLRILVHRRSYGLSLVQAARLFLVSAPTVGAWEEDVAREEPRLVKSREPLNRLPDIVGWLVHRLKDLHAEWGTRRIAHVLVRAGVKVSRSSAQRILRRRRPRPKPPGVPVRRRPLRAKRPGHIFLVDHMTADFLGLRRLYVTAVLDLFSRLPLAVGVFGDAPTAPEVTGLLARAAREHGAPRHVITDKGNPFRHQPPVRRLPQAPAHPASLRRRRSTPVRRRDRPVLSFRPG